MNVSRLAELIPAVSFCFRKSETKRRGLNSQTLVSTKGGSYNLYRPADAISCLLIEMARYVRVAEAIKKEVSNIVVSELKDPRLGFVTITRVELTLDLRYAKVFFSVLGKDEDYKKTKAALDSALGFIRSLVAEKINLRFAPEISFKEDRSSEHSVRIQEILDEIKELDEPRPCQDKKGGKIIKKGHDEPKKRRHLPKKK